MQEHRSPFLLAEPPRSRRLSVADHLETDRAHQAIQWMLLVRALMAVSSCGLIAAFAGLILDEPIRRGSAALLLAAARDSRLPPRGGSFARPPNRGASGYGRGGAHLSTTMATATAKTRPTVCISNGETRGACTLLRAVTSK